MSKRKSDEGPKGDKPTPYPLGIEAECRQEAFKDALASLGFEEHPTAEKVGLARERADILVGDYVKKRLSDAQYREHLRFKDRAEALVSPVVLTPLTAIAYWAERLGICKSDDQRVHDKVIEYVVAEHHRDKYQVEQTPLYMIVGMLERDARERGMQLKGELTRLEPGKSTDAKTTKDAQLARLRAAIGTLGLGANPTRVLREAGIANAHGRRLLRVLQDNGEYGGYTRKPSARYTP